MNENWTWGLLRMGVCLVLTAVGLAPLGAADNYWQRDPATPGDWFDPTNWAFGVPNDANEYVRINNGGTAQIAEGNAVGGMHLTLGSNVGESGKVELSGTGHVSAEDFLIGLSGTGVFVHTGGTSAPGTLYLGHQTFGDGTYLLSGTGRLEAVTQELGYNGTGRFIQTGGTNSAVGVFLGYWHYSHGVYELAGGQLFAEEEFVPHNFGSGRFIQTGGTNTIEKSLSIGWVPSRGLVKEAVYELSGPAELSVSWEYLGTGEGGSFIQTGGSHTVRQAFYLAKDQGAEGIYELSGTGQFSAPTQYIGYSGIGRFIQTGGTNVADVMHLGENYRWGNGTYELSGTGELTVAVQEIVGRGATAKFIQNGGTHTVKNLDVTWRGEVTQEGGIARIEEALAVVGLYKLGGTGQLSAAKEKISGETGASFVQTGGTNTVGEELVVGMYFNGQGTYELSGTGQLSAPKESIGAEGTGRFVHSGGTNTVTELYLGPLYRWPSASSGTYELGGSGLVRATNEYVGYATTGQFTQSGGTNVVDNLLQIGRWGFGSGAYSISGGDLSTGDLSLQYGTLDITDAAAQITVSNKLLLGEHGTLTAVPGATIHMTGAALENLSTDPAALAGLGNLTLIFEGGTEDVDPVEVAGRDLGPVMAGFQNNFALGALQIGGTDVGQIRLVDDFDNRPDWLGSEALYVGNLTIGPASYLDLSGLSLYFLNGAVHPAAIIVGGAPILVPEPSTLVLSVLGIVMFVGLTWRYPWKQRLPSSAGCRVAGHSHPSMASLSRLSVPAEATKSDWG